MTPAPARAVARAPAAASVGSNRAGFPARPPTLQMFTKTGQASRVSLGKEIAIGLTMGASLGFWWQT